MIANLIQSYICHLSNLIFTAAIPFVVKLSKVCLHLFKDLPSKLQSCIKRSYQSFNISGMNTDYLIVFVIAFEERTSTGPWSSWHVEYEIIFVNKYLPVILCQLIWQRIAYYSNIFEGLPNLIVSLQKVIAKATEVFFQVLFCFQFKYCVIKQKSWIFVQPF